jgi:hypothetical protein
MRDDLGTLALELEGAHGLTRERSTFTRRDVVNAFADAARDGAHVEEIERRVMAFLSSARLARVRRGQRLPQAQPGGVESVEVV